MLSCIANRGDRQTCIVIHVYRVRCTAHSPIGQPEYASSFRILPDQSHALQMRSVTCILPRRKHYASTCAVRCEHLLMGVMRQRSYSLHRRRVQPQVLPPMVRAFKRGRATRTEILYMCRRSTGKSVSRDRLGRSLNIPKQGRVQSKLLRWVPIQVQGLVKLSFKQRMLVSQRTCSRRCRTLATQFFAAYLVAMRVFTAGSATGQLARECPFCLHSRQRFSAMHRRHNALS